MLLKASLDFFLEIGLLGFFFSLIVLRVVYEFGVVFGC